MFLSVLNTTPERHAAALGLFAGLLAGYRNYWHPLYALTAIATTPTARVPSHRRDLQHETAYYAAAAIVGAIAGRMLRE